MGLYGSTPSAPDPEETASAQFNYDMGSTQASGIINNPNTYDPYGSTQYTLSGYETVTLPDGTNVQVPRYNKTTSLTQAGQSLLNKQNKLANSSFGTASRLLSGSSTQGVVPWATGYDTGNLKTNFKSNTGSQTFYDRDTRSTMDLLGSANTKNFNGLTGLTGDIQDTYAKGKDFRHQRSNVEQAVMSRANSLLKDSRQSENARLAAMGLAPGTAASNRINSQLDQAQNDLVMQAVLAGGQEQSRLLGESRSRAEFGNNTQAQEFAQRFGLTQAENARRMGETELFNTAQQGEFAMNTALRQMENARRSGDMQAYNAALESYNNAQIAQTQMNRDYAGFQNNTRSAQVGETEALKNAEINRLIGILSGAQVNNPQIPGYFTQAMQSPDYSGLVQNNYNQQVASNNAVLGAWSGLAGGAGNLLSGSRWLT